MRAISAVTKGLEWLLRYLVIALTAVLIVVIAYQVFGRYVLLRAPRWSEELARILMIWMTFLGAALLIRYKRSIALEFFVDKVFTGDKAKAGVWIMNTTILFFFAAFMVYWGWSLVSFGMRTRTDTIRLPLYSVTASIPVGGSCMVIFLLDEISTEWRRVWSALRGGPT